MNTSKPSSTKIMPYQVVYNKLPNLGNKKNFVEIDQDGKEVAVEEEEVRVDVAPSTSSQVPTSTENVVEEEMEEDEEDEEEDERILEEREIDILRRQLNENMDKNASMMIKKHDCKRNKETREFKLNDNVTVLIPRIDRAGTDMRRLPGKIVKISSGVNKFHTILTVWGVLNAKYRATSLEPFSGLVEVVIENEEGESVWEKNFKTISLSEAAKLQNASTGSVETVNVICNCGTVCYDDGRCKCSKLKLLCTSHCHGKMKGKPLCCKNHDKKGGVGKDAYTTGILKAKKLAEKAKK